MAKENDRVTEVVTVSEVMLRVAGGLPTARLGVASLALALGRLCSASGVDLDAAIALARIGHAETNPVRFLVENTHPLLAEDSSC